MVPGMTRAAPTATEVAIQKLREAIEADRAADRAKQVAQDRILDALVVCREVPSGGRSSLITWPIISAELGHASVTHTSQMWARRVDDRRRQLEEEAVAAPKGRGRRSS